MDKIERLQSLKDECARFLSTYTEESKASASEPAVLFILDLLHEVTMERHEKCSHPLSIGIKSHITYERHLTISVDLREKAFIAMEVRREDAMKAVKVLGDTDDAMVVAVPARRMVVSLRDMEEHGISPYEVVKTLNEGVDVAMYEEIIVGVTMPPARA